jgi:nanoRNase/pAp phosphatase (c-di-AMP/oligoRNAs hydrolase)
MDNTRFQTMINNIGLWLGEAQPSLFDLLERQGHKRHIIVLHTHPDPDAISAAYAHQLLSQYYGIETDIVYSGAVSHDQNIALVRLLNLDLKMYAPDLDLSRYDGAVYIDNQGTNCGSLGAAVRAAGTPALIVVDHHEDQKYLTPVYKDIRRTGSTAAMYSQYLENGPLRLDGARREHVIVATALMHGILTDTHNFLHARPEDFQAACYLSDFSDSHLLAQILSQPRSTPTMEIIGRALANRNIAANFSIAGVGYVRSEDRDAIPQAADFLMGEENVHTALVYGIVSYENGEEALVGSLRTEKSTLNTDLFIKELFCNDAARRCSGGGRQGAGGFQIPIDFLADPGEVGHSEEKWQVYDAQVRQKIMNKIEAVHGAGSGYAKGK